MTSCGTVHRMTGSEKIVTLFPMNAAGENFGKYIKVGVVEDEDVKNDLAFLCRFFSRTGGDTAISFDEYVENMKVRPGGLCT